MSKPTEIAKETICCNEFEQAVHASVIKNDRSKYKIVHTRIAPDGDGYIDFWDDEEFVIKYCPFCGKKLMQ